MSGFSTLSPCVDPQGLQVVPGGGGQHRAEPVHDLLFVGVAQLIDVCVVTRGGGEMAGTAVDRDVEGVRRGG